MVPEIKFGISKILNGKLAHPLCILIMYLHKAIKGDSSNFDCKTFHTAVKIILTIRLISFAYRFVIIRSKLDPRDRDRLNPISKHEGWLVKKRTNYWLISKLKFFIFVNYFTTRCWIENEVLTHIDPWTLHMRT